MKKTSEKSFCIIEPRLEIVIEAVKKINSLKFLMREDWWEPMYLISESVPFEILTSAPENQIRTKLKEFGINFVNLELDRNL